MLSSANARAGASVCNGRERVRLPVTAEAMACLQQQYGRLEQAQVFRLQTTIAQPVTLRGGTFLSASWPGVVIRPLQYAWEIADALEKQGASIRDVRLEGNAVAHCLDPEKPCTDLELVFGIEGLNRDYLYTSREIVLDCLCRYLPEALAKKDRHMIAAAYMQRMSITAPQQKPTDEAFSQFTLPGIAGSPNVHCKFVQVVPPPSKLDEYAVQIILSRAQLQDFLESHESGRRPTQSEQQGVDGATSDAAEMPDVRFECLVGTPADALQALTPAGRQMAKGSRRALRPLQRPNFQSNAATPCKPGAAATGAVGKVAESTKLLMSSCVSVATCACWTSKEMQAPKTPKSANVHICFSPVVTQPRNVVHIVKADDEETLADSGHPTDSPTDSPAVYL